MRRILLAFFATTIAAGAPAAAAENCQLTRITKVDMAIDEAGGADVPMTIGGKSVNLLIDTGGAVSMLTESTVKALDLRTRDMGHTVAVAYGGAKLDHIAFGHDIDFGGLKASSMDFLIMPDGRLAAGLGGTLAPDILLAYDDDFDFANGKFSLFASDHCIGRAVYWTKDPPSEIAFDVNDTGHVAFSLSLDGKDLRTEMDTGSSVSILSLEKAEELFGFDEKALKLVPDALGAGRNAYKYPFKTLTFGGVTVTNPDILLVADANSNLPGVRHFIIGISILSKLHLYISNKEKVLYVTPAGAH